jgi:DNA-binding transcriptional ArsR family regulator
MKPLSDEQIHRVVGRGRALSDATRVRIIDRLAHAEWPVGRLAAALRSEPSTISKHLQVLFREGLVQRRRAAPAVLYSLGDPGLLAWCRYLAAPHLSATARRSRKPTA